MQHDTEPADFLSEHRKDLGEPESHGLAKTRRRMDSVNESGRIYAKRQDQISSPSIGRVPDHDPWSIHPNASPAGLGLVGIVDCSGECLPTPCRRLNAHDAVVPATSHGMTPLSQYHSSYNMHTIQEMGQSQIFVAEQGNPGIATMNTNAIPQPYFGGNAADQQHQNGSNVPRMVPSPVFQAGLQTYIGQEEACLSATSSFHDQVEEDCFSPQSNHSAATSFCDASSPETSGNMNPYYYTNQLSQQVGAGPDSLGFGSMMMEPPQPSGTEFAIPNYQYQTYL